MPELPEVETIRRGLAAAVVGDTVSRVVWLDPRMVRGTVAAADITRRLAGQTVAAVRRRGKFLVWRLATGEGLLLHLGMSGRLVVGDATRPRRPHTHLVVAMAGGAEVRLSDPRRFGRVMWIARGRRLPVRLGPEPLSRSFTAARLAAALAGRRAPIKALLLDQRLVAGLGNIYVDEALFLSRIHPQRPAGALGAGEVRALHRAVRRVLQEAIGDGGTTFLDYRDATGAEGGHQRRLWAYGRTGQPCRRCGALLTRVVVAGRSSHVCARCQPPPASDANPDAPADVSTKSVSTQSQEAT